MLLFQRVCRSDESARPYRWKEKPTGCLLGACSGRTTGGTVSPYSPCCFQEYLADLNTDQKKSFAESKKIIDFAKRMAGRNLIGDRRWTGGHELGEARIFSQLGELGVFIHILDVFVAFLHRSPQVL